jgi:hypothetical protein
MPITNINLRLNEEEVKAIDDARHSTVPRTWWIRGAIQQRLGWRESDGEAGGVAAEGSDARAAGSQRVGGSPQPGDTGTGPPLSERSPAGLQPRPIIQKRHK